MENVFAVAAPSGGGDILIAMVRIDLHVHTARYSPCAEALKPELLEGAALAAGLAGVVLTDHDVLWAEEELAFFQKRFPRVRFFQGVELTTSEAHILCFGLTDLSGFFKRMPALEAVAQARKRGAFTVLAHPFRQTALTAELVSAVDAVEVASLSFSEEDSRAAWALATRFQKTVVAGSDAHAAAMVGWAGVELPELPENAQHLAQLLGRGYGVPFRRGPFPGSRQEKHEPAPRVFPETTGGGVLDKSS